MKKLFGWVILVLLLVAGAFYIFLYPKLEIVSGYNSKILCSCLYVTGLDKVYSEERDLGFGPLWLASNEVRTEDKSVHTSVFWMQDKTARYREGIGCRLISEDEKIASLDLSGMNYSEDIWPATAVNGSPELQDAIKSAFDKEGEKILQTRAVVVIKDGEIIGEAYGENIDPTTRLLGWSMTKSLTAGLVGILAKKEYWNLESKDLLPEWENTPKAQISLKNLLHMTSGLEWTEDYGSVSPATTMLYGKDEMGKFAASFPLEANPGEFWEYSSGTSNILAYAMRNAFESEEEYLRFPYEALFAPIGARSFVLETDATGNFVGSSYGYASGRDWAKLGLLFLNEGNWNGIQIIDSSWVDFCKTPVPASDGIYAGHFWKPAARGESGYRDSDYAMDGFQGQRVSIHPEDGLVIVRLGVMYDESNFDFGAWVERIKNAIDPKSE